MTHVYEREVLAHFHSLVTYAIIAFVLLFVGIFTHGINLTGAAPNFGYALNSSSTLFLFAVPVLTMRSIAEERRQKTDILLYSLPISLTQVVLGKYLAMCTVLLVPIAVMCAYPLVLGLFGDSLLGAAYSTIFAFFLLGAALLSIGMFISALTDNQAMAAVLTFLVMLISFYLNFLATSISGTADASLVALSIVAGFVGLIVVISTNSKIAGIVTTASGIGALAIVRLLFASTLEGLFPSIIRRLSIFERFSVFVAGEFDIAAIVYFSTVIAVFLFLTVQTMEKRRYN